MIRIARTTDDWPRRTSWLRWTLAQDLSEEGKLRRALLEIDGPAFPSVGWWIGAGLLAVVVLENLI